ncbi:MAG: SpoIIE family protein phosphatase [Pseudobdellovibrio sp.]
MSEDEVKKLKGIVAQLEGELQSKNDEVMIYRQELVKFSRQLDHLMSGVSTDMKYLSEIQKTLAPAELPTIPGFEISRKFVFGSKSGGDFFDFFEFEDKFRFGLLVASSSGYSMSALFLSFILKFSHILQAKKGIPPEQILQKVADELKASAAENDLTHAFYAVIDRRDYSLRFCSAGKILGFYLAPGNSLQILKSSASPFGKHFSEALSSAHIELEPRSRICVMTDGLSDVLGLDQIAKILTESSKKSVHEVRNELLFQASRISKLADPIRDQTVVVIDVKDRVIKLAKTT